LAEQEAHTLASDPQRLAQTLDEVRGVLSGTASGALQPINAEIQHLLRVAGDGAVSAEATPRNRIRAIAALLYLLNPYDDLYDFHDGIGYEDDIARIRQVHKSLLSEGCVTQAAPEPTGPRADAAIHSSSPSQSFLASGPPASEAS